MPAVEPLRGLRVVADPSALDRARWTGDGVVVIRFAEDDAFGINADEVEVDDEHAIVEPEVGFVAVRVPLAIVERHVEWTLPANRPALAQGSVAGVPAKVWLAAAGPPGAATGDGAAADVEGQADASHAPADAPHAAADAPRAPADGPHAAADAHHALGDVEVLTTAAHVDDLIRRLT